MIIEKLNGLEYPNELNDWLDCQLKEENRGVTDYAVTIKSRFNLLLKLWTNDDSEDIGIKENPQIPELLDAHIRHNYPKYEITDKGRLKMLYNLIRNNKMRILEYRQDDI